MDVESGLNANLDLQTSIVVANNARKGRKVFLSCCKGEKTDKGVTSTPKSLVNIVALAGCELHCTPGVKAFINV